MTRSRRKLEEFLWITGTHRLARSLHTATVGRQTTSLRTRMHKFYANLLTRDVLVFDIGANVGSYAAIFASLGARVVALEPNSDCLRHIQLSYPGARIETMQAVAGPQDGIATLNLSDERDDMSSLSPEWIAAIQKEHGNYQGLWKRKLNVAMLRLDTLIGHFGEPHFIKVDVEGFEEKVLDGLSTLPPLLSFEFNTAYMDATRRCLNKPVFSGLSQFNFTMGEPVKFELDKWVTKDQLEKTLTALGAGDRYGDIFVRRLAV